MSNPFGSPAPNYDVFRITHRENLPLQVLLLALLSQRKGLADLLAIELLKKSLLNFQFLGSHRCLWNFTGRNSQTSSTTSPCTNSKVQIMKQHDALVLPSIVEGRALVQQEALALESQLL